jgi:hypothetical protein
MRSTSGTRIEIPVALALLPIAKHAMMAKRYAHAKQFKRHHRQLRLPRIRLGRIVRDIRPVRDELE